MSSKLDALAATLVSSVGENHGTDDAIKSYISTGFAPLDKRISGSYDGGLPFGKVGEIYGPSSAGKTIIATNAMIRAQQLGGIAIFVDWERSFSGVLGENLGLNTNAPHFLYNRAKTWESGSEYAADTIRLIRDSGAIPEEAPIVVVFDSIAAAIPNSQYSKGADFESLGMHDTTALARVTSTTLKTMKAYADDYGATLLYLNQVREKPGISFGDNTTTPGGKAMGFFADFRISLTRQIKHKIDKSGMDHQIITAKVIKTKFTRPFQKASWRLSFDDNGVAFFDTETSTVEYCKSLDLLERGKGNHLVWDGKSYNGAAQLGRHIRESGEIGLLDEMLFNFESSGGDSTISEAPEVVGDFA